MLKIIFSESISIKDFEKKTIDEMKKSVEFLEKELLKIRTNRAHTSLVDGIKVENYGQFVALRSIAVITTPEPTTINIQPFDISNLIAIEKAISQSNIGTQAKNDGKCLKIMLPPMSQARRVELIKNVHEKQQEALISIRKVRQDMITDIKKAEKDKKLSQDLSSKIQKSLQGALDEISKIISKMIETKEKSLSSE